MAKTKLKTKVKVKPNPKTKVKVKVKPNPKSKAKSKAKAKSTQKSDPKTRKNGVFIDNHEQCCEQTNQRNRCKNKRKNNSRFCATHTRPLKEFEKYDSFDSTMARVVPGLWIGSLDSIHDPKALYAANIKGIVNISGWEPNQKTKDFYKHKKPKPINYFTTTHKDRFTGKLKYLGDQPIQSRHGLAEFYNYMDRGVDMISECKKPCLVNCYAGINRSASLIVAYLMTKKKMNFNQILRLLEQANNKRDIDVLTNEYFVEALKKYKYRKN